MARFPIQEEIYLAFRYLDARPGRKKSFFNFLNVAVSIGGVALGVAALVITLGVMSGFQTEIRSRIIGFNPHVVVFRPLDVNGIVKASGMSRDFVKPFILEQSVIQSRSALAGALIKGIEDDFTKELKSGEIKMGRDLARTLGVSAGEEVTVFAKSIGDSFSSSDMSSLLSSPPRMIRLKVAGFFETGMYEYDANTAVTTFDTARFIFGIKKNGATAIGIFIPDNPDDAVAISRRIISQMPYAQVRTWQQMNRSLFAALKLEKIMMFIILTLIILVAAFNIVSNLALFVSQKARDIGVLKSMGMTNDRILLLFMGVGLLLGLCGIIVGLGCGLGVCFAIMKYDIIRLPPEVYFISRLPVKIFLSDILWITGISIAITILAALWPAWKAARMNVSEILKISG